MTSTKTWTRDEVSQFVKQDLLLDRLQLGSSGVRAEDIQDDTLLLDEGLALDSVDALDLFVAVEKTFGIKAPDTNREFLEATCKDVQSLVSFIMENMRAPTGELRGA
jgi:acyl carrier protein